MVAKVFKVQLVPVDTVATLVLYRIHHLRIGYMPARHFCAYIGIMLAVNIEGEWKVEVELFLLESIAT